MDTEAEGRLYECVMPLPTKAHPGWHGPQKHARRRMKSLLAGIAVKSLVILCEHDFPGHLSILTVARK